METVHETPTMHTAQSRPTVMSRQTARTNTTNANAGHRPLHGTMSRQPTSNTIASHGLAGPPAYTNQQLRRNDTYYQDGYEEANPWMQQQENDGGGFSLAGNFPRMVRWQPKRPGNARHDTVKADQKGETETAPQMEATEDLRDGDAGHDPVDDANSVGEEESIKHQKREAHQHGQPATPQPDPRNDPMDSSLPPDFQPFNHWARFRMQFQRPLAEFLGMSIFIFLGTSANLSVYVSQAQSGDQQTVWWTWGFAVMIGIYIAGGSSGGFLNPMLVVMLSIFRGFPPRRIPTYILAQVFGAFIGALLAFAVHKDSIMALDGALLPETTGVNFYTQPQADYITTSTAFVVEMLGSAVISCGILALGDSGNSPPGAGMHALIIGLLITTTCMALGWTTRGCFNPARDLGPRLAALAVGYPLHSFTDFSNFWIWGAWVAPMVGGIVGGVAYDACIFKGGESPINYSGTLWKKKGLQKEGEFFDRVMRNPDKAEDINRRLEGGELQTVESYVQKRSEECGEDDGGGATSSPQQSSDRSGSEASKNAERQRDAVFTQWLDR
ncbi:hypothetical protein Q7P37_000097 [Cladosporium fusiforme]